MITPLVVFMSGLVGRHGVFLAETLSSIGSTWVADIVSGIGLLVTLIGAVVTARAVILSEDDAVRIGVARWNGTREENLKLPMVQNLLASSRGAQTGLWFVAAGSLLQLAPVAARLLLRLAG